MQTVRPLRALSAPPHVLVALYEAITELQVIALRGDGLEAGEASRLDALLYRAGRALDELGGDAGDAIAVVPDALQLALPGLLRGLVAAGEAATVDEALELVPAGVALEEPEAPAPREAALGEAGARFALQNELGTVQRELARVTDERDTAAATASRRFEELGEELALARDAAGALRARVAELEAELELERASRAELVALHNDAVNAAEELKLERNRWRDEAQRLERLAGAQRAVLAAARAEAAERDAGLAKLRRELESVAINAFDAGLAATVKP